MRPIRPLRGAGARGRTRTVISPPVCAGRARDASVCALCLQRGDRARARSGARADAGRDPPAMVARGARRLARGGGGGTSGDDRAAGRVAADRRCARAAARTDRSAQVRTLRRAMPARSTRASGAPVSPWRRGFLGADAIDVDGCGAECRGAGASTFVRGRIAAARRAAALRRRFARNLAGSCAGSRRCRCVPARVASGAAAADDAANRPRAAGAWGPSWRWSGRLRRSAARIAWCGNGCLACGADPSGFRDYSAAAASLAGDPAIEIGQRAGAERALARQVLGRAAAEFAAFAVEATGSAIGGNRPKFTFIGWNEDGPASMVSIWPPVICASSAPCAVVGGGGDERFAAPLGGGEARRRSGRWRRIPHSPRSR